MGSSALLLQQLERAQALGFLGPGPVSAHVDHALAFLPALEDTSGRVADLGSGAGVPGLALALARPDLELLLVDAGERRVAWLEEAVGALGLGDRVAVRHGRAEVLGRSELRAALDAVVARGFGPPGVTAECAAPLLRVGGRLAVSEPPEGPDRWPADGLARLGLVLGPIFAAAARIQVLYQDTACPSAFPRRDGMPAKRPLF